MNKKALLSLRDFFRLFHSLDGLFVVVMHTFDVVEDLIGEADFLLGPAQGKKKKALSDGCFGGGEGEGDRLGRKSVRKRYHGRHGNAMTHSLAILTSRSFSQPRFSWIIVTGFVRSSIVAITFNF